MKDSAEPRGTPWKWDTTLLDREGWKSDSAQCGNLWKLEDGTIVVRLGGIWEYGYFRDQFIQRTEDVTLCSRDNGVSWQEYSGPPLYNAVRLSDGTLIERAGTTEFSSRHAEMKELVKQSLGVRDEDLAGCIFGRELWPESKRGELEEAGCEVEELKGMPGVVGTLKTETLAVRRSFDKGKTWELKNIAGLPLFASLYMYGTGVALSDDTILFAAPGKKTDDEPGGAYALRSADRGQTWEVHTVASDATGANAYNETDLLELPDGRIIALLRHDGPGAGGLADPMSTDRYICRCYSEDGGVTWSAPERTPIWGFPFRTLLLQSGKILGTYAYRRRPFGIRGCLSHDLGQTWDIANEIIIRDDARQGGPVGSAQSIQADDGTILTFYGISKISRKKPKSPYRWYPDDVHPFVGLSRYTEDYVRARGQSAPPSEREETPPQSENILDNPSEDA